MGATMAPSDLTIFFIFWLILVGAVVLYVVGTLRPEALVQAHPDDAIKKDHSGGEADERLAYAAGMRAERVIWYGDFRKDFRLFWYQQMPQVTLLLGVRHPLDPEPVSVKAVLTVHQAVLSHVSSIWINAYHDDDAIGSGYVLISFYAGLLITPLVHGLHGVLRRDYSPALGYESRDTVFGGFGVGVGVSSALVALLVAISLVVYATHSSLTESIEIALLVGAFNILSNNVAIVFEYVYRVSSQADSFQNQAHHKDMYPVPGLPSVAYLDRNAPKLGVYHGCCCCPDGLAATPDDAAGHYGSLADGDTILT